MEQLAVKRWVETFVVDLNICPFAGRELIKQRIRFVTTESNTEHDLLLKLEQELGFLMRHQEVETTLLIHPHVLQDFFDYNQFLNTADQLLAEKQLEGVFQIASFHPQYQFAGTDVDDAENYTNRSPYPLLHILREASVENAIASHPDVEQIPINNIKVMNKLGSEKLAALAQSLLNAEK